MKRFDVGDIVYYKYKNLKCIVKYYTSNSLFERTYTIMPYDKQIGRMTNFKVKSGNIETYTEYIRNKKLDILIND